jgi:hypothetical protein
VLLHGTNLANNFILVNTTFTVVLNTGRHATPLFEKLKPVRMKNKTLSPLGSMHPILFFVFVYGVALLFSIFICSSLFYSCNAKPATGLTGKAEASLIQNDQVIALKR